MKKGLQQHFNKLSCHYNVDTVVAASKVTKDEVSQTEDSWGEWNHRRPVSIVEKSDILPVSAGRLDLTIPLAQPTQTPLNSLTLLRRIIMSNLIIGITAHGTRIAVLRVT
jgi:hypothetical protein